MKTSLGWGLKWFLAALLWLYATPGSAFYDPAVQRWVNRDPIGEGDGPNMYRFTSNLPIGNVDADGRAIWQPFPGQVLVPGYDGPTPENLEIFQIAIGILLEPVDWAMTGVAIYNDPSDPWSYTGIVPSVPSGIGKVCKKVSQQFKRLSPGEIKLLKKADYDPHDLKPNSKYDLFKDEHGNIYVMPKDGSGPGEPTGINIDNP